MNILTPTGYRDISTVKIGDRVIGRDGVENTIQGIRTFDKKWFQDQKKNEWHWYIINGWYEFFGNQNIIVADGDYSVCHVSELKVGWKIIKEDGTILTIESISKAINQKLWYKLDISGDRTYISEGILVHNASRFWVGG